jgi:hypothetical protein
MKTELRINGRLELRCEPETDLEKLVFRNMQELASKGRTVTLGVSDDGKTIVSVEQ